MPYRRLVFTNNEIYHIANRGVARAPIFLSKRNYQRFTELMDFYRFSSPICFSHYDRLSFKQKVSFINTLKDSKPLAEFHSYCLIPNHFHLLAKQIQKDGIKIMMSNLQNAYVKYFNTQNGRIGPLFQSVFHAVRIETDEQLLHVSRYIHLNPSSSSIVKIEDLIDYPWSSLPNYLSNRESDYITKDIILGLIKNKEEYKKFVFDQAEYQKELNQIKHLLLE